MKCKCAREANARTSYNTRNRARRVRDACFLLRPAPRTAQLQHPSPASCCVNLSGQSGCTYLAVVDRRNNTWMCAVVAVSFETGSLFCTLSHRHTLTCFERPRSAGVIDAIESQQQQLLLGNLLHHLLHRVSIVRPGAVGKRKIFITFDMGGGKPVCELRVVLAV